MERIFTRHTSEHNLDHWRRLYNLELAREQAYEARRLADGYGWQNEGFPGWLFKRIRKAYLETCRFTRAEKLETLYEMAAARGYLSLWESTLSKIEWEDDMGILDTTADL